MDSPWCQCTRAATPGYVRYGGGSSLLLKKTILGSDLNATQVKKNQVCEGATNYSNMVLYQSAVTRMYYFFFLRIYKNVLLGGGTG